MAAGFIKTSNIREVSSGLARHSCDGLRRASPPLNYCAVALLDWNAAALGCNAGSSGVSEHGFRQLQ